MLTVIDSVGEDLAGFNLIILEVIDKATGQRLTDYEDDAGQEGHEVVTEPEPIPAQPDADKIALVDAAYRFADASDAFKTWLAESVDRAEASPFATAKAMDEAAQRNGATIEWGLFGGATLDFVFGEPEEWDEDEDEPDDEDEDDDEPDAIDPNQMMLFDAADDTLALDSNPNWSKQPRDRKTGQWRLRRLKRAKEAVSRLIDKALSAARRGGHALVHRAALDAATAELAAIALDAANDGSTYVGKIVKDGQLVGRADIGDDGKAMVFIGESGSERVQTPSGIEAMYSDDDAPAMVDWLLAGVQLIPDGAANLVKTAKGTKVETGFTVVEADTLIVSHDSQGNLNPDYPAELQPRDRGRETSLAWVRKTANQLDPDSLGKTRRADTGAPIVGPDRVVESGNGRTMAIQDAYRSGKADEYREWLIEEAASFGLDPERIRAMQAPVLVRVRTSGIDRRTFAIEANQDDKLAMTATEKARADADRLDEALLSKLADDGDLLSTVNRDFVRGFLASLGDAEAAQYITTDGQPTAGLIARVQAAVFAKAYRDDRLLELTADASKPEIANILNALNAAALEFIRAQAANREAVDALTTEVADSVEISLNAQAVQAIIDATNLVRKARADGQSIAEVVNQRGLFDDIPPATAAMALFIHQNNRSAKRMATAFRAMARHVRQEAERGHTVDLFGDVKQASLEDIIGAANRELEREYGEGQFAIQTLDLFSTQGTKTPDLEPTPEPEIPPTPTPTEDATHSGFRIYQTKINTPNGQESKWAVQSIDNFSRAQRGEREVGGDALFDTKEQAMAEAESQAVRMESDAKWQAEEEAKAKAQADAKAARISEYADFVEYKGYSPASAEKARQALEKQGRWNGKITTIKSMIEALVAEGRTIGTDDNGARGLESVDGEYFMDEKKTSKIGMDYAEYLISKREANSKPNPGITAPSEDPQKTADRALFQSVIDGLPVEAITPELMDDMIAAYERWPDDPEMEALATRAVDAYQEANLAAADQLGV